VGSENTHRAFHATPETVLDAEWDLAARIGGQRWIAPPTTISPIGVHRYEAIARRESTAQYLQISDAPLTGSIAGLELELQTSAHQVARSHILENVDVIFARRALTDATVRTLPVAAGRLLSTLTSAINEQVLAALPFRSLRSHLAHPATARWLDNYHSGLVNIHADAVDLLRRGGENSLPSGVHSVNEWTSRVAGALTFDPEHEGAKSDDEAHTFHLLQGAVAMDLSALIAWKLVTSLDSRWFLAQTTEMKATRVLTEFFPKANLEELADFAVVVDRDGIPEYNLA
jgi:hypothetical protein